MLSAVYGFAAIFLVVLGLIGFLGTRRILLSPDPGTPLAAVIEGWQGLAQLFKAWPLFVLIVVAIKVVTLLATSGLKVALLHDPVARFILGVPVDLAFTLVWAFVALRIDMAILAPQAAAPDIGRRVRRAVLYALAFWGANLLFDLAAFLVAIPSQPTSRMLIKFMLGYTPYIFIVLSALTRPAIAIALPRPFRECLRILRENWFGLAITLLIGVLPLGAVFLGAFALRLTAHLTVVHALLIEIPLGALAALFYAGFEATIAAAYRRIM